MKSVVAESIRAGIPGGMFGAVMSFVAAYFLVPFPAAVANGVDNAVSGLISGFIAGFLGIFFYVKTSQARSVRNKPVERPGDGKRRGRSDGPVVASPTLFGKLDQNPVRTADE